MLPEISLQRNIDVVLEPNPVLGSPLGNRDPEKTLFVFQSPAMFKKKAPCSALWLVLEDYKNPDAIARDLAALEENMIGHLFLSDWLADLRGL
jgi:hypothetical protein